MDKKNGNPTIGDRFEEARALFRQEKSSEAFVCTVTCVTFPKIT